MEYQLAFSEIVLTNRLRLLRHLFRHQNSTRFLNRHGIATELVPSGSSDGFANQRAAGFHFHFHRVFARVFARCEGRLTFGQQSSCKQRDK
jgi:hypothetical protein